MAGDGGGGGRRTRRTPPHEPGASRAKRDSARVTDRRAAHRGGRRHRRAPGPPGLRARDASLAAASERPRRVARRRLRDRRRHAALPRLGPVGETSRRDRDAPVRPRPRAVGPAADRHPLRPDQHVFRRRGERAAAGQARALEREAQRLPLADPRSDARCQRLRAPLEGLRRQRPRAPHPGRHARRARRTGRRPRGRRPRRRHRGRHQLAPRESLSLPGGQPRAAPAVRCRRRRVDPDAIETDRASAQGRRHRPRRGPPLLLLGGTGREGTRHRRAFRHPLRGRPDQAQRRTVTAARPQARRSGLAAHRAPQGPAYLRRRPLPSA